MKELVCEICGKKFLVGNRSKTSLCKECRPVKNKYIPEEDTCPICGTVFLKKRSWQKYCSRKCKLEHQGRQTRVNRIEKVCNFIYCNKTFMGLAHQKYCSKACAFAAHKLNRTAKEG